MSTIYIGSARYDESGNFTGGSAGDQLQKSSSWDDCGEVAIQAMYTHSKGWYVLRPKTVANADAIAQKMIDACNNVNIGYDQNQRNGIVTYGIGTTTKCECDCSSLMRVVVKEATGTDPGNFTTETEVSYLSKTGLFEDKISYTSSTTVYNGDILVTKTKGHTAAVISGNPRTGSTKSSGLTVDGEIGKLTVARLQTVLGTYSDGVIDGQNSSYKKYYTSICSSACAWNGGSSAVVKAWQKLVGASQDGVLGQKTAQAIQTYLINNGYSCGSSGSDGYIGTNSAKAIQNWLNAQ